MVKLRLIEAGCCCHPEFVTLKGGGWRKATFPAVAAVIEHPTAGTILFDTGYSPRFFSATRSFPNSLYRWATPVRVTQAETVNVQMAQFGSGSVDVSSVVLSHFHADHIGGVSDFPNARIIASDEGWKRVKRLWGLGRVKKGFLPALLPDDFEERLDPIEQTFARVALPASMSPFTKGWDLIGDRSLIAVALPGHAAGQMGLYVNATSGPAFLVADACWSSVAFEELRYPSELSYLVHENRAAYRATLARLHRLHKSNPELRIIPAHCSQLKNRFPDLFNA
ncbi:MBL fold metallo-hydrolase [Paraburkholderia sp. UCT31]|uniref:MBL fold metallo-hydrolase n=1 Tax=Paraburkholderia sp. UCT31 TaxID=2615209 RepID=UPI001655E69E|nr:MBL fold metallo-hydrolase [Paraburkholderia sp. UCT31]MBC8742014.1 MBL fold metallo-hydrolase [Paraburkholderia sp. UCT31]